MALLNNLNKKKKKKKTCLYIETKTHKKSLYWVSIRIDKKI
jgi:hypothetical protein